MRIGSPQSRCCMSQHASSLCIPMALKLTSFFISLSLISRNSWVQDVRAHQTPVTSTSGASRALRTISQFPSPLPRSYPTHFRPPEPSPHSSTSSDHTTCHILTASWEHFIGFWDTVILTQKRWHPHPTWPPFRTA